MWDCNAYCISDACVDKHNRCSGWANSGECKNNPLWMLQNCPKSCQVCLGVPGEWSSNLCTCYCCFLCSIVNGTHVYIIYTDNCFIYCSPKHCLKSRRLGNAHSAGVSITLVISGHWRCSRRLWPLTGAARPLSPRGVWRHAPPQKKKKNLKSYLEARKCDFQRSGYQKACCWWVFLLTTLTDFFIIINIIFIFINEIQTDSGKRSYRQQ